MAEVNFERKTLYKNVLSLGVPGITFKFCHDSQTFVISQAHKEMRPPNCWVSEDAMTYVVGRHTLTISTLRAGIQDAYDTIWAKYQSLVGDWRGVTCPLSAIVDDMNNSTRGYSLISESPFQEHKHDCFFHLVKFKHLSVFDNKGGFCWNQPAMKAFLRDAADLWRVFA